MRRALAAGVATAHLLGTVAAGAAEPDSAVAIADTTAAAADTTAAAADTTAATADSTSAPLWFPDPSRRALRTFRVDWSADRETVSFGDPVDPTAPPGFHTLGQLLRLLPAIRTRELSQGPTAESFGLDGGGSGRAELLYRGRSLAVPGTSAPHSHELMLTEIEGITVVRGGAAALYGPGAVSGAVLVEPRHPIPDELLSRAVAEEGVDDYQRGGFHLARRLGAGSALFLSSESRRIDGFFPGSKEVDRQAAGTLLAAGPGSLEMSVGYRRFEGDGRHGALGTLSALTKIGDYHLELFRPGQDGRGTLLELTHRRERLENNVGTPDITIREIRHPAARITTDLPAWRGWDTVARAEVSRWEIDEEGAGGADRYVRAAGALRLGRRVAGGGRAAATVRLDGESHRKRAIQARLEGDRPVGPGSAFAVLSRGERIPDRGAAGNENEVHDAATIGYWVRSSALRVRAAAFASNIRHFRRDPTFEEVRARIAVRDAAQGDARVRGASLGFDTDPFPVPGLRFLGRFVMRSSATWLEAERRGRGERLPGRPRFTWTGEGHLERTFFKDELLARLRGRLTHWHDRVDNAGDPVIDLWTTDVLLDGRIGDAVFFFRFHDLLERADEIEPGIRLPGFSRMYGISWRFVG